MIANEVSAAATISLRRDGDLFELIVRRTFDDQELSFGLRMPEDKLKELRTRVPQFLTPFREKVGRVGVTLSDQLASAARNDLSNAAWATVDLICKGSGWKARPFLETIREHLRPVFGVAASSEADAPIVRLEATATDSLASLLPLELW